MTDYGHRLKAFSLRMEKETRQKLEEQAKLNERTLTSEINYRLNRSLIEAEATPELVMIKSSIDSLSQKLDEITTPR